VAFDGPSDACRTCHYDTNRDSVLFGGRFPQLSIAVDSADYCQDILKQSFGLTMPIGVANPQPADFSTYLTLLEVCDVAP
jgi:hypothetical protein